MQSHDDLNNQTSSQDTQTIVDDVVWQNGEQAKKIDNKDALEQRAKQGTPMHDFSLTYCDMSGINLVNRGSSQGYQMTKCDFYHSDMSHAHCFKINLSGSSLMKANFSHANLHCADLSNCNLLGTNFEGAKLENIYWGNKILQEQYAERSSTISDKNDFYEQAEEIYRHLRLVSEKQGLFETAGGFFQREMVMRRKQLPQFSFTRFISKLVDLFCGYGELPIRVVMFSWATIFSFSLIYFLTGVNYQQEMIAINFQSDLASNLENLVTCLYFSVITFTTLGYGDITPTGITRVFAALEALMGSFTLALFVVVFVKKMTR